MKNYLSLLLIVLLAACSGIKVLHTETADNANLSKYKTFGFYRLRASGDTVSKGFDTKVSILKTAIANELTERGYSLQDKNPDLWVNIGIVAKEQTQTRQTNFSTDAPLYIGQRTYTWKSEEVEVGRYREGTVTLHLVDAAQNKMVWKGAIQGILPESQSGVHQTADAAMRILFKKFPVAVKD